MTSKLTIEQAKRLRNDFECWQQDYDPKDDKEQYDMFGRGMVAMDMLIAGMYQEPVAYMVRRHDEHKGTGTLIHAEYLQRYQDRGDYHYTPLYRHAQQPVVPENRVTAEHRRVIEMLLNVCGAAFELADDSCHQDVDGEDCHVVPDDAFQKLSDALDEIENTLPTEDIDRPDVFLAWSAMPRAALKSILQAGNSPVITDSSRDALEKALAAMEFMGDTLNNLDAVCTEDVEFVAPAFDAVRSVLAAAPQLPGSEPATVPGKWVPVSERMPEDRMSVILWDAEIAEVTSGHYSHKTQTFYHCGDAIGNEITHWMPPPSGPKEAK